MVLLCDKTSFCENQDLAPVTPKCPQADIWPQNIFVKIIFWPQMTPGEFLDP